MGEKREQYNDMVGKLHLAKEGVKEKWTSFKDGQVETKANEFKEVFEAAEKRNAKIIEEEGGLEVKEAEEGGADDLAKTLESVKVEEKKEEEEEKTAAEEEEGKKTEEEEKPE